MPPKAPARPRRTPTVAPALPASIASPVPLHPSTIASTEPANRCPTIDCQPNSAAIVADKMSTPIAPRIMLSTNMATPVTTDATTQFLSTLFLLFGSGRVADERSQCGEPSRAAQGVDAERCTNLAPSRSTEQGLAMSRPPPRPPCDRHPPRATRWLRPGPAPFAASARRRSARSRRESARRSRPTGAG